MRLGIHLSMGRGLKRTMEEAQELGCNTVQIFSKNPRSWKAGKFDQEGADLVYREKQDRDLRPWVVHATYLINPCSPDDDLYYRSREGLELEIGRAELMGADYYVLHPGNRKDSSPEQSIKRLQHNLAYLLEKFNSINLLVEGMAGRGSELGASFLELSKIVAPFSPTRVGICLDTCHLFAAGWDIRTDKGWRKTLDLFFSHIDYQRLQLIHVNDSVYPLGSRQDRHTHLGQGKIGREGFRAMINRPELREIPLILETPGSVREEGRKNLEFMRRL